MAPVEGRSSSMHITAGTVQQYRHAYKLTDFFISRTAHQDLFREPQNASNRRTERGTIRIPYTLLQIRCRPSGVSFILLRQSLTKRISADEPYPQNHSPPFGCAQGRLRHRGQEVWFPWSLLRALRASVVNFHSYGWRRSMRIEWDSRETNHCARP